MLAAQFQVLIRCAISRGFLLPARCPAKRVNPIQVLLVNVAFGRWQIRTANIQTHNIDALVLHLSDAPPKLGKYIGW